MGTEIVVSATRTQIRNLESPVSIERMGSAAIQEVPAANFYDDRKFKRSGCGNIFYSL
jgi:hypothetical protein